MPNRNEVSPRVIVPQTVSAPHNVVSNSNFVLVNQGSFYPRLGKRLIDFSCSLAGLILLMPILVVIGTLVKANSRGPVLFKQQRVGKGGKVFWILKFRSMVDGAERAGMGITPDRDPRVTPLGVFLRKWKLDELPQLWNVLVGEMSLVGPRPELSSYVQGYTREQTLVLEVRPGITDPASIQYRDESSMLERVSDPDLQYREKILPKKLSLNLQYLKDISFTHDLSLIVSTIKSVLGPSQSTKT